MTSMIPLRRSRRLTVLLIALGLLAEVECSRPVAAPGEDAPQAEQHPAPFQQDRSKVADPVAGQSTAAKGGGATPGVDLPLNDPPFDDRQSLPAGTLLTVRLAEAVSAGASGTKNSFAGLVDQPVEIEGKTLIPPGAAVMGRVESARISSVKPNRGYLRLALQSVRVGGMQVPVQTASLFARQAPVSNVSGPVMELEKGRRLTFRLTEPAYVASQSGPAVR